MANGRLVNHTGLNAAMDNRSVCSVMHKSMDSTLTDKLPTSCPQTYAQRFIYIRLLYKAVDRLPTAAFLLLLSILSVTYDGIS